MTLQQDREILESFGFNLVTVAEFDAATDVPEGSTRELVRRLLAKHGGTHIVYDPDDDDQGWLLVGDAAEIARETVEHRCTADGDAPAQPSFF